MKNIPIVLLLSSLFFSCAQDYVLESSENSEQQAEIIFTQASSSFEETRAVTATRDNIASYGVTCSWYESSKTYSSAACGSYFFNVGIDAASGVSGYYWPGQDYRLSFFAYYPCGNPYVSIVSAPEDTGMPQYRYNIPSDVSHQTDFLTCNVLDHEGLSRTPVPLLFNHKCAAIRFAAYNKHAQAITLESISVIGMHYKGVLADDSWILDADVNSELNNPFLFTPDVEIDPGETKDITGTDNHFIVLPQTVSEGSNMILVKTQEEGEEHTYTYILPQSITFSEGRSYRYRLNLGPEGLVIDPVNITPWESIEDFEGDLKFNDSTI